MCPKQKRKEILFNNSCSYSRGVSWKPQRFLFPFLSRTRTFSVHLFCPFFGEAGFLDPIFYAHIVGSCRLARRTCLFKTFSGLLILCNYVKCFSFYSECLWKFTRGGFCCGSWPIHERRFTQFTASDCCRWIALLII
jgi:hypothetical protein